MEEPIEIIGEKVQVRSLKEYVFYKLDRNLAIAGIIGMGIWSLYIGTQEAIQIAILAVGALATYLGNRAAK